MFWLNRQISTHTLTWSVTLSNILYTLIIFISTHTLTWSVTKNHFQVTFRGKFQLTRSRGAWLVTSILKVLILLFQLTRSRGAWPTPGAFSPLQFGHFNSHAHVERDQKDQEYNQTYIHFNSHAHVERDNVCGDVPNLFIISTHTLTWSVTVI